MKTNKFTLLLLMLLLLPFAAFNQTANVQVIHNSADLAAKTVDVYVNDVRLLDDFEFRTASDFVEAPAGSEITIDVAPGTSASSSESIYSLSTTLTEGGNYILIASGIISSEGYSPATPFEISVFDMGRTTGSDPANTDVLTYHGVTDAPTVGIWNASPEQHLISPFSFGDFASSGYLELTTNDYILEVRDENNTTTVGAYSVPLATLGLQETPVVVVASGFLDPGVNNNGPMFGLFAATPDGGALVELEPAYQARLQVIHNSADAAAEMVDVYLNDEILIDDFAFRSASAFIDAPAGAPMKLNVAPSNSTSSLDAVFTTTATLAQNETYVGVASGIVSESGYSPSTPFSIDFFDMGRETASDPANTDVLVYHGVTDAPTVGIWNASPEQHLISPFAFGDFGSAGYLELATNDYVLEVRDEGNTTTVGAYAAPLSTLGLGDTPLVVIASGFLDPTTNSNGPIFGLYAASPDGGELLELPAAYNARLQVIHNSADAAADMVDVYLNDNLLIDDFAFRTASPFIDAPAGAPSKINVAPSNSASSADAIYTAVTTLEQDSKYVGVASGIVSESGYDPITSFDIDFFNMGREEASTSGNTDLLVYHGSTDAPTVDIFEATGPSNLVDNIMFGEFSSDYLSLPTADYFLQVRNEDGSTPLFAYDAPLATLGLEDSALVTVASGFVDPSVNSDGAPFGLFVALPEGGDMIELPSSTARLQVIHNSADMAADSVDVYLNGELLLDDFAFRTATPFIDAPANTPVDIDVAPKTSSDVSESIYTLSTTLEADEKYVLVASGIVSSSGYTPVTPFEISVYPMGREMASTSGETDLLVYHGSSDAPMVDIYEATGPAELVNNIAFGDFSTDYISLPTDDYYLQVRNEDGSTPLFAYDAPLATLGLEDSALVAVASGFVDPSANSDGAPFGLFVALPEGGDLIELPSSTARLQVIHNSADMAADSVDVYLNGDLLLDNFAFRTATPFIDAPANTPVDIDIAPKTSSDVSESIYNLETTLMADETYILVASGIVSSSGYTPAAPFEISVYGMGQEMAMNSGDTDVLVYHGSTDAPTVDIYESTAGELVNNASFGDFAGYLNLATQDYTLEVRDETGSVIVAKFNAPLETLGLEDSAITVLASGFLDPSMNSEGPAFGLYASLASGGELVELPPFTVKDVIVNSEDHTTLETAVVEAGLDDDLSSPGKFTVFAPTDAAFSALPDGVLDALLDDPTGNLAQILLYHVAGDSVRSTTLTDEMMISTLQGQDVTVNLDGGVFINNAEVTVADIKANNGIVHVINAVLLPENDVKVAEDPKLGQIITDMEGNTLYFFTKDASDTSSCVDGCIANWPAFYTQGLYLPEGLDHEDFGSIERPDGSMQSTYKGWPLYYFVNDNNPGDVNGDGVNDVWYVAKPNYTIMLMDDQLVGLDGNNYTGDYQQGEEIVQFFTNGKGTTLYTWINDVKNTNNFTNEDFSNNNIWPIYEESDIVVPSALDSDLFGVIDVFGRDQLTYKGWPLYYFGSDSMMRGSTKGVSVPQPGVWPVAVEEIQDPLPATVVEIVVNSEAHDTLETAVVAAELAETLSGDGPFTVFAPTDSAFAALPDGTLDDLLADPTGELAEILQYHVVSGKVLSGQLSDGMKVETLLGDSIMVTINDQGVFINDAKVTTPDLEAGNGVVHVIDAVLLPPVPETVVDIVVDSDIHTTLETAVVEAELADDLSGDGPFTVFAPTDAAFDALPDGTLDDLLADPTGELAEILQYHVISSKVMSGDLSDGIKVETLLGDSIMVTINDQGIFINDAKVIAPDLEAQNGVVHVIDAVLLPPLPETVVDIVVDSDIHTTLETAVIEAELADDLSGDGPFTVFAPTDAAFDALPDGTLDDLLADPTGDLANILQYHVVSGKVLSSQLSDGMKVETLLGDTLTVEFSGGDIFINDAQVIMPDLEAQNGVVHVIDGVLLPTLTSAESLIFAKGNFSVYPNPAATSVTIEYTLKTQAEVSVEIYNILGSEVRTVSEGIMPNGVNRHDIDVSEFESGLYFIVIKADNDQITKSLNIVR